MSNLKQLMEQANAVVPKISPSEAREIVAREAVLIIDVRDAPEIDKTGKVAGAVNISRGMLEFRADPESPYYDERFSKERAVILYCASGGRSALAGKVMKDMGYDKVFNLGAIKEWIESGGKVG